MRHRRLSPSLALLFLAVGCAGSEEAMMEEADQPTSVSGPAIAVEARPIDGLYLLREDPLPVSGCHSGGDSSGRTIAYSEQTVDVRVRAFGFTAYDVELAELLGLSAHPTELGIDVGETFGVDPGGTVSSADNSSLRSTTGFVSPGRFGVFYRQTAEVRRPANIVAITEAGDEYVIGELVLTDWDFRGDIGTGNSCPPFPPPPSSLTGE
jgi:hypothetical protein